MQKKICVKGEVEECRRGGRIDMVVANTVEAPNNDAKVNDHE